VVRSARPRRARTAPVTGPDTTEATAAPAPAASRPAPAKRAASKVPARRTPEASAALNGQGVQPPARLVTDDDIRLRAYFLSLEHRGNGSDIDFWLIAERELRPRPNPRG
jgi:hypothetical protein